MGRKVEPRDYQRYLRASAGVDQGDSRALRGLAALLPQPPPNAALWAQAGMLLASAVLPLLMWGLGKLEPLDVILLYFAEGTCYALCVLVRIVVTAAPPGMGEAPRTVTAAGYALWHGAVWSALILIALYCMAAKPSALPMADWLGGFGARFGEGAMWLPVLSTAAFLVRDVVHRSDYIDAYLDLGPRQTARYGYIYPMALAFLLGSAFLLRWMWLGEDLDATHGVVPAAFLAAWLIGWRLALQLLNLTTPLWARSMARATERFEQTITQQDRRN
ncbi:MAG: hypothetical protein JSS42_08845 [Proteobacteria bacterium]|uniref:DUF6498-containing protein n=1 Tax=Rudaea sp. TaxID=2136325 RepID=UPI003220564B|nr:hypothetical protein [Pseudomonadota bacterium]